MPSRSDPSRYCSSWLVASPVIAHDLIVLADITNLNDVLTKLEQFSKDRWRKFGLRCGLHYGTLKTIQANYPRDAEGRFTECVACWLRREDDVDEEGKPMLQRLP